MLSVLDKEASQVMAALSHVIEKVSARFLGFCLENLTSVPRMFSCIRLFSSLKYQHVLTIGAQLQAQKLEKLDRTSSSSRRASTPEKKAQGTPLLDDLNPGGLSLSFEVSIFIACKNVINLNHLRSPSSVNYLHYEAVPTHSEETESLEQYKNHRLVFSWQLLRP